MGISLVPWPFFHREKGSLTPTCKAPQTLKNVLLHLLHFSQRLPASFPKGTVFKLFGIEPKTDRGVAGSNHFCKNPRPFVLAVDNLEVSPAPSFLLGCPFRTN